MVEKTVLLLVIERFFSFKGQTWKKLIFVRKPIFGVEKCPQIHIVPKHIKVPKIPIFSMISVIF